MIEFKNVTKEFGSGENKFIAVKNANFSINKGELVVILGQSGAGKSTVLNMLGGLDYPTSGEIIVDGEDIAKFNSKKQTEYRALSVGFVFQFYNLIPSLTVFENVNLIKEVKKNALNAKDVLAKVGLETELKKFPSELSGGQQQRVSIARALVKSPKLLLCDEPTGALDSKTGVIVLKLLKEMSEIYGETVIIVTHNQVISQIADKTIYVKNGEINSVEINKNKKAIEEVEW